MLDQNGKPMSGRNSLYNSGFNGTFGCPTCNGDTSGLAELTNGYDYPNKKYYDAYIFLNSDQQYQRRILGDATGEMGPFNNKTYLTQTRQIGSWHGDYGYFTSNNAPWFARGNAYNDGSSSGIFAFRVNYGYAAVHIGFRVVLTPV